jgi:DNA repair ATPase RecN
LTDTEYEDLLAQQQRDRQQLLAYAARLDQQAGRITELEGQLAQQAEIRRRFAEEIDALRAWQDAMQRSRTYRLLTVYRALYEAPVIGALLRLARRVASALRRRLVF